MTPEAFAMRCREIVSTMYGHDAHRALDALSNDLLRSFGYGEGVGIFEAAVESWHEDGAPYPRPGSLPGGPKPEGVRGAKRVEPEMPPKL